MKFAAFLLLVSVLLGCAAPSMDRGTWERMSPDEKLMYVRSLLGAEQARRSKGGNDRIHPAPAEEYVKRIDEAYARGDRRSAEEIFISFGERRGGAR